MEQRARGRRDRRVDLDLHVPVSVGRAGRRPLAIVGHPIYPTLLPVPIVCFAGALITDFVYSNAPDMMWLDFSSWLLVAGLSGGGMAGVVLIAELFRAGCHRRALARHFAFLLAAWVVEVFNSFIHARDGWTAVVPAGITLSAVATLLSFIAGWFWQSARATQAGEPR